MDAILAAHTSLEKKANLSHTITAVQSLISQLETTRDSIQSTPELTSQHVAKLKQPVQRIEEALKEVNKGLNQYQKALRDKFKSAALPTASADDVLGRETGLVNRAVAMHLLREGKFGVARTFVREVNEGSTEVEEDENGDERPTLSAHASWIQDFADPDAMAMDLEDLQAGADEDGEVLEKGQLQRKFAEMYHILDALRNHHNLGPAIAWSVEHSSELEHRGSNLEFELSRLKFVELYTSSDGNDGMREESDFDSDSYEFSGALHALDYARTVFPSLNTRYTHSASPLLGSLAFSPALSLSPYHPLFNSQQHLWDEVSASFTREFCGMLGLSSHSPLHTAVTAGGIALPILEKVERVMAQSRGQWTSVNELPVETPLPPGYLFHSIFVCPVSKEQATDANPPMLLPCGHVIAKESLEMHARGKRSVKCPYCPGESQPREARRVYI